MKRFALLFILFGMTALLAGCDWFSTATFPSTGLSTTSSLTSGTDSEVSTTTTTTTTSGTDSGVTTTTTTMTDLGYVVTFYDEDGMTLLGTDSVLPGGDAIPPVIPTKASTAQFDYAFAGWSAAITNITGPLSVTATYTQTVRNYTVTFFNDDGTTQLGTSIVPYGSPAVPPANPTKASTAQYDYAFAGWSAAITSITGPLSVNATYTQTVRNYTVTFFDEDGTTQLGTSIVAYGSPAVPPVIPTKPSTAQYDFAFAAWSAEITNITGPLSVHATYTQTLRNYTVTFFDEDGTTQLGTSVVAYGSPAVPPANPSKPSTTQYDFAFAGWSAAITNITGTLSVHATYTQTLRNYTVTFYDDDGSTVLGTSTVAYGSPAVPPAHPTKASTAEFDYAFTDWDVPFDNITGTLSVKAVYAATVRSYEVVFRNADGTELKTETVEYGHPATAPDAPIKPSTPQYDYLFTGWDLDFDPIVGDTTVNAVFSEILREYAVVFYDDDGFTVLSDQMVPYGGSAIPPADPVKAGDDHATYSFSHWDGTYLEITGHEIVIAVYDEQRTAYFVSFYDIDGSLIEKQLVDAGQDAVAPADPICPSTAQYTYTFTAWLGDFTAVSADIQIYAQYDVVVNSYTVEFYSEDGLTLLGTSTVEYGHPALAPEDPAKPDFFFIGWSEGTAFVTRDMVVLAVFSNVVWNRQFLLDYVATWHDDTPTPEQLEEDVLLLLDILGLDPLDPPSEQQAYELVMVFQGFLDDLMNSATLAEFQEAYVNAKSAGFDRARIITVLLGVAEMNLEEGINNGRVEEILAQIAWLEQMIVDAEAGKAAAIQAGHDYCTLSTGSNADECLFAWDIFVTEVELDQAFIESRDSAQLVFGEAWDWDVYYDIENLLYNIFYYTYGDVDTFLAQQYNDEYVAYLAALTPEEVAMYSSVFSHYSAYQNHAWTAGVAARMAISELSDIGGGSIHARLADDLIPLYEQLFWDIRQFEWHIVELHWQLEDAYAEREILLAIQAYLATPEGSAKAEILIGTVYDVFESVLFGIDEGTFNLLFGLATGQIDPETLGTDAASLLGYIDRGSALIRLFLSTVDSADLVNVKSILVDALGIYAGVEGLTEEETSALVALFSGRFDEYALMVEDVYGEFLLILDSLDEEKIQIILDQIQILQNSMYGLASEGRIEGIDMAQIVAIAKIADILAYQSGADVEAIAGYIVRLYYDMNYEFCYDDAERLAVTAALQDSVARILQLVHVIASYDTDAMPSPAQLELLFELKIRVETIAQAFGQDWPTLLLEADYTTYTHEMFLELIYRMNDGDLSTEEAEAQITMLVATFESSEQDTFFIMLAFANVFRGMGREPSVASFSDFYFGLVAMGYDNETLSRIITNFLVNFVDYQIAYSRIEDEIAWYEQMIGEETLTVEWLEGEYARLLSELAEEIGMQPLEIQVLANEYIQVRMNYEELWREVWRIYNLTRNSDMYYDLWNDYLFDDLVAAIDLMAQYGSDEYYDPTAFDDAQYGFNLIWNSLTEEERNMYLPTLDVWAQQAEYYWNTVEPAFRAIDQLDPVPMASSGYNTLLNYLDNHGNQIQENRDSIAWRTEEIANWTAEMTYLQEHGLDDLYRAQTFLADPLNRALIEDSIQIVLDDFAGILATMDTATIDQFIALFTGRLYPEDLDFSAAAILGYTQNLSAILKAVGATVDDAEFETLMTLALKGFALYLESQEGMTEDEKAAILEMIEGVIRKYVPIGFATVDVVTDFLDSLTIEKIQIVLDQLAILGIGGNVVYAEGYGGPSDIEMAIAIATIVDTLLYDGSLDTDALIATAIEIYYDFARRGDYNPDVKAAVLSAFQGHVDELILIAHELAGADPQALSPAAIAAILELRQRFDFLRSVVESGNPELILEPATFGYQRWMFVELLWNLDWEGPWNDEIVVEATITAVTQVFETSEEESYYQLVSIMNLVKNAIETQNPETILAAIDQLSDLGFTDEEIAAYLGNLPLALLTYQQFMNDYFPGENPYAYDLEWAIDSLAALQTAYDQEMLLALGAIAFWQGEYDSILALETEVIPLIVNPDARQSVLIYFNEMIANIDLYLAYYELKAIGESDPAWNYDTFTLLQYDLEQSILYLSYEAVQYGIYDTVTANNYLTEYNNLFAALSVEQQNLYGPVLAAYAAAYEPNVNSVAEAEDDFNTAYWASTPEDQVLMELIGDQLSYYWNVKSNLQDALGAVAELSLLYDPQIAEATAYLAEMQALYDSFEPEDLVWLINFFSDPANDALWNTVTLMLVQEIDNLLMNITPEMLETIQQFIQYQELQGDSQQLLEQIYGLYWQLDDLGTQASDSIAELSDPISIAYAQTWWNVNVVNSEMWAAYWVKIENAWEVPDFDYGFYAEIEGYIDEALYEEIVMMDLEGGLAYREQVDLLLAGIDPAMVPFYMDILSSFETYRNDYYTSVRPAEEAYYGHMGTGEDYTDELQWAQEDLLFQQQQLASVLNDAQVAISSIVDGDARGLAQNYWTWSVNKADAYLPYFAAHEQAWMNPSWDEEYYYYALLEPLRYSIYHNSYESGLYGATNVELAGWYSQQFAANLADLQSNNPDGFALYAPLLDLFAASYTIEVNQWILAQTEFLNYYYGTATGGDLELMGDVDYYCNSEYQNNLFGVYQAEKEVAIWQELVDANGGEFSFFYFYVDSLVWSYRDTVAQLRWKENELAKMQAGMDGLIDLTPAGIAGYAQMLSGYLGIIGDSIDGTESQAVLDLLYSLTAAHIAESGLYTEEEQLALMAEIEGVFEWYMMAFFYAPDMLSNFLTNLTEDEIARFMDALAIVQTLGDDKSDLANMTRAVGIADMVLAVAGDGNLDFDALIGVYVRGYFDSEYHLHYEGPIDIDARILYLQTLIDDILLQAEVIDEYDPNALTEEQRNDIVAFHILIEELIPYFDFGPEYEPIV